MKLYNEFNWDQTHDICLMLLKDKFSLAPILRYPDFLKEFAIKTDASKVGLEAVLTQIYDVEGKKYFMPVSYASRYLKGAERQYSMKDLEALAVVWAVQEGSPAMYECLQQLGHHSHQATQPAPPYYTLKRPKHCFFALHSQKQQQP